MTKGDPLRGNAHLVDSLGHALRSGEHGLSTVPGLLKRVLKEESWREFVTERGEYVEHERFAEFVTTPPLKGIGSTIEFVRRVVDDDTEALDLLDQVLQNPVGVHHDSDNITISDTVDGRGDSRQYALRRLRKDSPELHAEVLAGNLSAHAAMVQAGFRPRTITVRTDDPERIAATLRRQLQPETISRLIELLDGR